MNQQKFIDMAKHQVDETLKEISKQLSMTFDPPDGDSHNSNLPYYNDVGELIIPSSGISTPTGFSPYIPINTSSWNYKMYGLPQGQMNQDYDWLQGMTPISEPPKILCECGTTKTLGEAGDNWEFHSAWCECHKQQRIK